VADTKDYTLAAVGTSVTNGLREIAALRTDDHVLSFIGRDDSDSVYPLDVTTSGEPWYWSYWADTARLYPTPDAVYTVNVRGYKNPTAFGAGSSDSTEPSDLPTPFHVVVATYGVARAYEQQEDPQMAAQYFAIFNQELDNLKARHDDAPAPQPIILNGRTSARGGRGVLADRLRYAWE
jgi:hypothetical protein